MVVREETTFAFLVIPSCFAVVNVALCGLLSLATKTDEDGTLVDQAKDLIGYLTNASIAIVTLTFSLTVLSIQIAAQAYSPRLLDEFLRDPVSKLAVGVNLGAYSYGFTLTYFLKNQREAPHVAIHFLSVHMCLVLLMFVYFIHHFVNGFRLETILHQAVDDSWKAALALESLDSVKKVNRAEELPEVPPNAYKVMADQSGYVAGYQLARLKAAAKRLDLCIRYHPNIGEFVAEGTLLAYVWDANSRPQRNENDTGLTDFSSHQQPSLKARILRHSENAQNRNVIANRSTNRSTNSEQQQQPRGFIARFWRWDRKGLQGHSSSDDIDENERLTEERLGTLISSGVSITAMRDGQMDVSLGILTLTDIAVKALSAAINDPMTAVQALDFISTLFGRLAALSFSIQCIRDSKGVIRACAPRRSFSFLLSVPDSIRFYGGSDLQVVYRLMRFYGEVGAVLKRYQDTERMNAVLAQLEQCLLTAQKNFDKDSSEYISIQEVYQYSVELIVASNGHILGENEAVEKDLTDLETTFAQPTDQFLSTLPPEIQMTPTAELQTEKAEDRNAVDET
mmetsp:Transcript_8982/g.24899  ORF Transcript_8982/g.24899 Transcript_8982/m.24899 type:complete len:567 (+) Transcript_8982:107-1807(+)